MFSRVNDLIMFEYLSLEEKEIILDKIYYSYLNNFSNDERNLIENSDIYIWHKENLSRYKNVRIIKSRVEKAVNDLLVNSIITN